MPTMTDLIVIAETGRCYTEARITEDGEIELYVEDAADQAKPTYTVEQAEALHRALGHLLYLANQEA